MQYKENGKEWSFFPCSFLAFPKGGSLAYRRADPAKYLNIDNKRLWNENVGSTYDSSGSKNLEFRFPNNDIPIKFKRVIKNYFLLCYINIF